MPEEKMTYQYSGGHQMLRILFALLIAGVLGSAMLAASSARCFLNGERTSGMNKICFYDCISGKAAITIKSTQLCPLSIEE